MDQPRHIVVVEDEPEIRGMVAAMLREDGYRVTEAGGGRELDAALAADAVDLVLLDVMLPGEDGLSICRRLAGRSDLRIIMVTARGGDIDRIVGLELGADDYVAKPFNPRELVARVRSVLRRVAVASDAPGPETAVFGEFRIDFAARSVTRRDSGETLDLSSGEYDLLAFFVRHPGRVLDRDQLLDGTRGRQAAPFDRTIDVQISKLRRKLGDPADNPVAIKTIRGGGYMLALPVRRVSP